MSAATGGGSYRHEDPHASLVVPCRYEEEHGLEDAVRFQKKLKNDFCRLERELEERTLKVSLPEGYWGVS